MTAVSANLPLLNKRILLAITGSVAACKADRIISELKDRGATVQVLLTSAGRRFFTPETAGSLTDPPVLTGQFDPDQPGEMNHIDAKQQSDLILVAPATANRLLQMNDSKASDLLGTVLQAFNGPVLYAPAMNPDMWNDPELQKLIDENYGEIIDPDQGSMACGETGTGRLSDPEVIAEYVCQTIWPDPLENSEWIVSGGPTREPWDPIRFLSNRSSGRMGEALARMGSLLGGSITLITGAKQTYYPVTDYSQIRIETTEDLLQNVLNHMSSADGYIGSAAVSDYKPVPEEEKIRSGNENVNIELKENPDILKNVRAEFDRKTIVGFSADQGPEPDEALKKAREKELDAIVFNSIEQEEGGFSSSWNEVCLCLPEGEVRKIGKRTKNSVALQIWFWLVHEGMI